MPEAVFTYTWNEDLQVSLESVTGVELEVPRAPDTSAEGVEVRITASIATIKLGCEPIQHPSLVVARLSREPIGVPGEAGVLIFRRSERAWTIKGSASNGSDVVLFLQKIGRLPQGEFFLRKKGAVLPTEEPVPADAAPTM